MKKPVRKRKGRLTAPRFSVEEQEDFFAVLGRALAMWQWVEQGAFLLFSTFARGADHKIISATFHHIQSFDSRLKLLNHCANLTLSPDPLAAQWRALYKRLVKLSARRNQIVHFAYAEHHERGTVTYELGPSHMNALFAIKDKWKSPDQLPMRIDDLERAAHDFRAAATELHAFRAVLGSMPDR